MRSKVCVNVCEVRSCRNNPVTGVAVADPVCEYDAAGESPSELRTVVTVRPGLREEAITALASLKARIAAGPTGIKVAVYVNEPAVDVLRNGKKRKLTEPLPSGFPNNLMVSSGPGVYPEKLKFEKITLLSVQLQLFRGALQVMSAWADSVKNAGASSKGKRNLAAECIGNEYSLYLLYNSCTQKLIPLLSVDLLSRPRACLAVASRARP